MKELFAVYLESLDQNLQVFLNKEEAQAKFDELEAAGKPVKMQSFADYMIVSFGKANGCSASDPGFWEEIQYDNGSCRLIETFCWHSEPDPEGYYADYMLSWK